MDRYSISANRLLEIALKLMRVLLSLAFAMPMTFGITVSSAAPATSPFVMPAGSLVEQEKEGMKKIAKLEEDLQRQRMYLIEDDATEAEKQQWLNDIEKKEQKVANLKDSLEAQIAQESYHLKKQHQKRPDETSMDWVNRMTEEFDVKPHPGTKIIFSEYSPCHLFNMESDGCVTQNLDLFGRPTHQNIKLFLGPDGVGNIYILFHEIGHTHGIMDECMADEYSRSITGLPGGHYCP